MEIILKAVSKKIGYTQVLDNINCLFLDGKYMGSLDTTAVEKLCCSARLLG